MSDFTEEQQELAGKLGDRLWRLNNLYWITDDDGNRVKFGLNWAQERLFSELHYCNLILKARQLGFTTFIQIFMLDVCLFNSNIRAGTIAHTLGDAEIIFRDKVKFPYDNLPEGLKVVRAIENSNMSELVLNNNSSIRVGTSLRSGTLQYLHISEYGKICAKYPEKAREVRTGALNTVSAGNVVFVESTAEGQDGHFFNMCESARSKARIGTELTPLDFKFNFFAWWEEPSNSLEGDELISAEMTEYFDKLEPTIGVKLDHGQRLWYAKKAETQLGDMKREYPATPDEAFEASVEGAYYGEEMAKAELEGRIGLHEFLPGLPVNTVWDIGRDTTAIWFWQTLRGKIGLIKYYANSGEGAPFYIKLLIEYAKKYHWRYGSHCFPHDLKVKEWGSDKSRIEQLIKGGIKPVIVPNISLDDGINATRAVLPFCYFNKAETEEGVKAIKAYRKEWNEDLGVWRDKPRHDWSSHGSDALRYLAVSWKQEKPAPPPPPPLTGIEDLTMNKLWQIRAKEQRTSSGMI